MSNLDQLIESGTSVAQECIKLITLQNDDSYKTIKVLKLEPIKFNPKTHSTSEIQLMQFYHSFMPLLKFSHDLKYVVESMVYPADEIAMHVDRSPKFILDLEHKLVQRSSQIQKYADQLKQDIQWIIQSYCAQLHTKVDEIVIELPYLELMYRCMAYDFKFIQYGVAIMSQLFADNLINHKYQSDITRLSNELKCNYLDVLVAPDQLTDTNNCLLQTFNLIPSTKNLTLVQVFKRLFALIVDQLSMTNLEDMLRSSSKKMAKHISFLIVSKSNNDFYYDLSNLFDRSQLSHISSSGGVSTKYIYAFKTLQSNLISKKIRDKIPQSIGGQIKTYNYHQDMSDPSRSDSEIYILWTNDHQQFKLREQPVPATIVHKLLAYHSSDIIDAYNKQLEDKLLEIIKDDQLISYKQVKYLSFDTDNEEHTFIDLLCHKITKCITSIKNIGGTKGLSDKFMAIIQAEFNKFKPFHKKGSIPVHALLVYNNMAMRISYKLEKEMIIWSLSDQPIDQIESIVRSVIASNDNIYTKFIASYYLAVSGHDQ